ncbi:MAG: molecular chaperone DnaJ [Myxococcota bacterium]|jgi:molecular chaperone DnaJ|nr:molecular chaperone DnaJ [Myxococcota bacterium]
MSTKPDYYDVLGVSRDVDAAELKRAYRKHAMQFHPDRNQGDAVAEEKFKQGAEAYQVLSDDEKRQVYDRYGHEGLSGMSGVGGGSFEDIFGQFSDIFGDIFGGFSGGGGRRARRGADLRYDLGLTFEEAAFGVKREITFPRQESCDGCQGSGAAPGTTPKGCGSCQGTGRVSRQQGFFMVQTTCPVCRGAGRIVVDKCGDCDGQGIQRVERRVTVTIPPGVDSGNRLRVAGEGEGAGAGRGDLYVFISVQEHDHFQRDGADIYSEVEIPISDALLGAEITVPTLHGDDAFDVPQGTRSGTVVRLRGRGVERLGRGGVGDHFVQVNISVPKRLSEEQRQLVDELKKAGL